MLKSSRIPGLGYILVSFLLLVHQAFADGIWFNTAEQDYNVMPVCQAAVFPIMSTVPLMC